MKTIKTLLKELLRGGKPEDKNQDKDNNQDKERSESNTTGDNQPSLQTLKLQEHETENHEDPRNPELDNPVAGENHPDSKEATDASQPSTGRGDGNTAELKDPKESEKAEDFDPKLSLAYEKGLIDGRNAQIEEKYFPKTDDGIPHFRGRPSKSISAGDIFSMAREA